MTRTLYTTSVNGQIRVGTCGFHYYDPGEGWKDVYESKLSAFADAFDLVEINRTFYGLPTVETAERWRREVDAVNDGFEFTLKAWQAITHPTSSPTWRGVDGLTVEQREGFGYLRPNDAVRAAWEDTREIAHALDAEVVVIQTPPSFRATEEHESNVRELLGSVDRGDLAVAWEPRGDWADHPDRVEAICADLDLIHVVDVARPGVLPRSEHPFLYTRLHGLNDDPYDYDYDYSADELSALAGTLSSLAEAHARVYCQFNNAAMYEDARELRKRL